MHNIKNDQGSFMYYMIHYLNNVLLPSHVFPISTAFFIKPECYIERISGTGHSKPDSLCSCWYVKVSALFTADHLVLLNCVSLKLQGQLGFEKGQTNRHF